jgi:hypothetical protein
LAAGSGAPPGLAAAAPAALLDDPRVTAYLSEEDGVAAAAGLGVLADAGAAGAYTAFLHARPAGVPLYQALGFRVAEQWTHFTAP